MIHIAIIGAGGIALAHAKGFLSYPKDCVITAVCNQHPEKAQALIDRLQITTAKAYSDLNSAAKECPIDAVSICLPPAQHPEVSIEAMEAGMHVLVEKPMANSLEECDAMIEASIRTQKQLSVVCQLRFTEQVQKLKSILQKESAGRLLGASVQSHWYRGEHYHDIYWRGTWAGEGGGVLTAQAIHHVDLLQYLMGMPERVSAHMSNVGHSNTECEDVLSAIWEYSEGRFAQFDASLIAQDQTQKLRFYTDQACFEIPHNIIVSGAMPNGFPCEDDEKQRKMEKLFADLQPTVKLTNELHAAQIGNFLRAIQGKETLLADGAEGRKPVEINTAIYKAAVTGQAAALPISKEDVFYTAKGKAEQMPHYHEKTRSVKQLLGDIIVAK